MIPRFGDGRDWFFAKRFGMFVHWGIYALPGWHEQHQWRAAMPSSEYVKLADQFNPIRFDPDEWVRLAKAAGMEYVVFTAKHLDGFCLWNTALTDFNVMHTPYSRDVLAELATACRLTGFTAGPPSSSSTLRPASCLEAFPVLEDSRRQAIAATTKPPRPNRHHATALPFPPRLSTPTARKPCSQMN